MLGAFNLPSIGHFVVSGDTADDFLQDLFDHIVTDGNRNVSSGSIAMNVQVENPDPKDSQDRLDFRKTEAWRQAHSNYFCALMTSNAALFTVVLPETAFFNLHKMTLLSTVIKEKGRNDYELLLKNNIALSRHGFGTPGYLKEMKKHKVHDYPYADMDSTNLLNYLISKQIVVINFGLLPGLMIPEFAKNPEVRQKAKIAKLVEEQKQAAIEAKRQQKADRPKKARVRKKK